MSIINFYYHKLFKKIHGKAIKHSIIHKTAKIGSGTSIYYSDIDKYSYCGYDCNFYKVSIGKFCSISSNVDIGLASHPYTYVSTSPVFLSGVNVFHKHLSLQPIEYEPYESTQIGNDVWIGNSVKIIGGVVIGNGAIIGTSSVVTKDIPPYAIVVGIPAKILKYRFDDSFINFLQDIKWWDLDENHVSFLAKYMNNPELFKQKYYEIQHI